ncbi:MAG: hypothetical protein QM778_14505 [Myxococcales bacterium]
MHVVHEHRADLDGQLLHLRFELVLQWSRGDARGFLAPVVRSLRGRCRIRAGGGLRGQHFAHVQHLLLAQHHARVGLLRHDAIDLEGVRGARELDLLELDGLEVHEVLAQQVVDALEVPDGGVAEEYELRLCLAGASIGAERELALGVEGTVLDGQRCLLRNVGLKQSQPGILHGHLQLGTEGLGFDLAREVDVRVVVDGSIEPHVHGALEVGTQALGAHANRGDLEARARGDRGVFQVQGSIDDLELCELHRPFGTGGLRAPRVLGPRRGLDRFGTDTLASEQLAQIHAAVGLESCLGMGLSHDQLGDFHLVMLERGLGVLDLDGRKFQ